jgi:hypothetical protein
MILALATLLFVFPVISGFAASNLAEKDQAKGTITGHEVLDDTKSIIKNLKQTKIFKDKDIIWNQVDIFSYKDLEVKGVVLSTKDPYVKYAIYYKPDKDIFCSFYIKSELHYVQKDTEKKLAGTFAYYDKNGNLLAKASYDKGKLVDVTKGQIKQVENDDSVQIQAFDCDWDCVQDCITSNFEDLPGWLQFLCDAGCGACLFGGNPYGCSVCLGCLIGYGWTYCYENCCI